MVVCRVFEGVLQLHYSRPLNGLRTPEHQDNRRNTDLVQEYSSHHTQKLPNPEPKKSCKKLRPKVAVDLFCLAKIRPFCHLSCKVRVGFWATVDTRVQSFFCEHFFQPNTVDGMNPALPTVRDRPQFP